MGSTLSGGDSNISFNYLCMRLKLA